MNKCSISVVRKSAPLFVLLPVLLAAMSCRGGAEQTAESRPAPAGTTAPDSLQPGDTRYQIQVDGRQREYLIHIPQGYPTGGPAPLVIVLHGGGGAAQGIMQETGWDQKADDEGFLAAFPEGTRPNPRRRASFANNPQTWNDGSERQNIEAVVQGVNDVAFIAALLDDISERYDIDPGRVYATGFSNGAGMTFRLGRELSERLAAIAPVASTDWLDAPTPDSPPSLIYITGTDDPLNPIEGGEVIIGKINMGVKPPAMQSVNKWADMLGCVTEASLLGEVEGVSGAAYQLCSGGAEVVFWSVVGLGHWWPGATPSPALKPFENIFGAPSEKLDATEVIWTFFKGKEKGAN